MVATPSTSSNSHRWHFLCDAMLKGLARWLRFLGFPAEISGNPAEIARFFQEHPTGIFLTRSAKHVSLVPDELVILLSSDDISQQLRELNETLSLFPRISFLSLCSVCNVPIQPVSRESVRGRVPEKVWENFQQFWECPRCRRIYWEGGHIQRLRNKLKRMGIPIDELSGKEEIGKGKELKKG